MTEARMVGMLKVPEGYENLSHRRIGTWTVLWLDEVTRHGVLMWLCYCDCGMRDRVRHERLVRGASVCCPDCEEKDEIPGYETPPPVRMWPVGDPCESCNLLPSVTGRCGCS